MHMYAFLCIKCSNLTLSVGHPFVGLKDTMFEPSSSFRHMTELCQLICSLPNEFSISLKPILFIYSDGGPDHRLTYISVQLSLICIFLKLDLDYLCACRTAPYHSWKNPVERIMSVINLGLQCVGLAREELPEALESEVVKCNNLAELRRIATKDISFITAVQASLSPVKTILSNIFKRLSYHNEAVGVFTSATSAEISDFWSTLLIIDSTLQQDTQYTKKNFEKHTAVKEFMLHCCQSSHYCFDILKCGQASCHLCKPPKLPPDVFKLLYHLPHPMPGIEGHYASFFDVFGQATSEDHRPSLKKRKKKNTLSFYASVQHVRNTELMLQCDECGMWRLIYSKLKLNQDKKKALIEILDQFSYTCGSRLADLHLGEEYANVEVKDHVCGDPIETLYYAAKFDPICIYCGQLEPYTCDNQYPQCADCSDKSPIFKK